MNLAGAPRLAAIAETIGVASSTVVLHFSCCCFWPIVRPHDSNTIVFECVCAVEEFGVVAGAHQVKYLCCAVLAVLTAFRSTVRCEPVQPDMEKN